MRERLPGRRLPRREVRRRGGGLAASQRILDRAAMENPVNVPAHRMRSPGSHRGVAGHQGGHYGDRGDRADTHYRSTAELNQSPLQSPCLAPRRCCCCRWPHRPCPSAHRRRPAPATQQAPAPPPQRAQPASQTTEPQIAGLQVSAPESPSIRTCAHFTPARPKLEHPLTAGGEQPPGEAEDDRRVNDSTRSARSACRSRAAPADH